MTEKLRNPIAFNIREYPTDHADNYRNLFIQIAVLTDWERDPDRPLTSLAHSFSITYQGTSADRNTDTFRWYAPTLNINSTWIEDHEAAIKLLKKLIPSGSLDNVNELYASLAAKAEFYYYDPRLSQYVTQLSPSDFTAWHDDNDATSQQYIYTTVLALDESHARALIFQDFTRQLARSYEDSDIAKAFQAWLNHDKPIKKAYISSWQSPPDHRTPQQLLKSADKNTVEYSINL